MSQADDALWSNIIDQQESLKQFNESSRLWQQDSNSSGQYNGEFNYDLSTWSNNASYIDWSSAVLVVPYVVSAKSSADSTGYITNNFITLKNNACNILNGLQVEINNKTLCNLSTDINVVANTRLLTSISEEEYKKLGPSLFLAKDSTSGGYGVPGPTGTPYGLGYFNNSLGGPSGAAAGLPANEGLLQRHSYVSNSMYATVGATGATGAAYALPTVVGGATGSTERSTAAKSLLAAEARHYFTHNFGAGAARVYNWVFITTIRLRDLSDLFNAPISKGFSLRMKFLYNSFKMTIKALTTTEMLVSNYIQQSGNTCPIVVSCLAGSTVAAEANIEIAGNIVKNSIADSVSSTISSTRIYVDSYRLNAPFQKMLLDNVKSVTHTYLDYQIFDILNVSPNNTFNNVVSNGIPMLRQIFVIPYAGSSVRTTWISPFSDNPSCSTSNASVQQFNVLVGGKTLLMNNIDYTWDVFLSQIQKLGLNGGVINGITSGIINQKDFENNYRFMTVYLGRTTDFEDAIPKSLQVMGKNNSNDSMSYLVIALYEKSITYNPSTGEVISTAP